MTLQNRVDPYGRLIATPERGTLMGNRGILHDESKRVVAAWRTKRWIACVLDFRCRKRQVFTPRKYSELFFLDEATALAAGHRPCAECRRQRYNEFCAAWVAGNGGTGRPRADAMDTVIHADRFERGGGKKTYEAALSSLPEGAFVERDGREHLIRGGLLLPWNFAGYGPAARDLEPSTTVRVLTPASIVRTIRAGFVPVVHPSAGA